MALIDPSDEGIQGPRVRAVVLLRELEELTPSEVWVHARASINGEQLGRRRDGAVQLRVEEEGERPAGQAAVDDGAVEAADVAPVGERGEGVADVDDEGVAPGPHGTPRAAGEHLQPADVVLVEQRQRRRVVVRARAQRQVRLLAWRVVVQPHQGVVAGKEAAQRAAVEAQARRQDLRDVQCQACHLVAVFLPHIPHVTVLLAEDADEVVDDLAGALRRGGAVEGHGLLPGELAAEPPHEAAGVAVVLAEAPLRALLLGEGQRVEGVAAPVRLGEQRRVHAVVHDLEEPVPLARRDELIEASVVAGQEPGEVDDRDDDLLHAVHGRGLVGWPDELRRDVLLPAQHRRVEHEAGHLRTLDLGGRPTAIVVVDWQSGTGSARIDIDDETNMVMSL